MSRQDEIRHEWSQWCEAAMLCDGPLAGSRERAAVLMDRGDWAYDSTADGLCTLLYWITHSWGGPMLNRMLAKKSEAARPNAPDDQYWWPCTDAGWKARAEFCWRRAAECEAELCGK